MIAALDEIHVHSRPSLVNRSRAPTTVDSATEPRPDHALMLAVRDGELETFTDLTLPPVDLYHVVPFLE